jgi:hypothetical protein
MPIRGAPQSARDRLIQLAFELVVVAIYFSSRRPIGWLVGRQATAYRIDSKGKKLIEGRVKRLQPKAALRQQIPIEGFDVTNIKNNAMPLGNRAVVQSIFANDAEYIVRTFARIYKASVKVLADADSASRGSHAYAPPIGCGFRWCDASRFVEIRLRNLDGQEAE